MGNYAFINPELAVKLYREIKKLKLSSIQGSNHKVTINNQKWLRQEPKVTITILSSVTNPVLNVKNNNSVTQIQIPGSFVTNDKIVLDSTIKKATKNSNTIINQPNFPIIERSSYCEMYMTSSHGSIQVDCTTLEDKAVYVKSRDDFDMSFAGKKFEMKRFYNSDKQTFSLPSSNVQFSFGLPIFDEYFLDIINKTESFYIEIEMDNSDERNVIKSYLANCILDVNLNSSENALIKYKISGTGQWFGETPSLSELFSSDHIQLIITNSTKNQTYELSMIDSITPKYTPKYKEKKVFRQKPKKILEMCEISLDVSATMSDNRLATYLGDNMTATISYFNKDGSVPITVSDVSIDSLSYPYEKDGFVKQSLTLTGNL